MVTYAKYETPYDTYCLMLIFSGHHDLFHINASTGVITVAKVMDREDPSVLELFGVMDMIVLVSKSVLWGFQETYVNLSRNIGEMNLLKTGPSELKLLKVLKPCQNPSLFWLVVERKQAGK